MNKRECGTNIDKTTGQPDLFSNQQKLKTKSDNSMGLRTGNYNFILWVRPAVFILNFKKCLNQRFS